MTHAFTMMTAREQPERYGWRKTELESLGLSIKKTNEFNDLEEISNLVEILKQDNYLDYLSFLRRLIILRGPMGSGKSSVSTSLMELLGVVLTQIGNTFKYPHR